MRRHDLLIAAVLLLSGPARAEDIPDWPSDILGWYTCATRPVNEPGHTVRIGRPILAVGRAVAEIYERTYEATTRLRALPVGYTDHGHANLIAYTFRGDAFFFESRLRLDDYDAPDARYAHVEATLPDGESLSTDLDCEPR
jgi:hypothetical protein